MLKKDVLRGKHNFDEVYKNGKSIPHKYIIVFYKKNNLPYNRIAFLASKKVGNAVGRNRARRLMRESFRLLSLEKYINFSGYDIIFIARKSILEADCSATKKSMAAAIRKTAMKNRR